MASRAPVSAPSTLTTSALRGLQVRRHYFLYILTVYNLKKKYLPRIFNPQVPAALHDPTGTKSGVCYISLFQSVHLSCSLGQVTSREEVEWYHYIKVRHIVQFAPEKHVITSKRGLIVNSIAEEDSCRYDCVHHCTIIVAVTSSLVF